eukprot:jgi/Mesen1/4014/ME000211S03193
MEALVAAAAPAISSLLLGRISSCSSAHLKQKYVQSSCILSARLQGSNLVAKTQRSSLATIPVSLGKFQKIEVPRKRIRGRPFVLKASTATADMSTSEREISVGGKGGVALKEYADMKALAAGFSETGAGAGRRRWRSAATSRSCCLAAPSSRPWGTWQRRPTGTRWTGPGGRCCGPTSGKLTWRIPTATTRPPARSFLPRCPFPPGRCTQSTRPCQ